MKYIYQTIYSKKNPQRGNCLQAVIASIFELPLKKVPNFIKGKKVWWKELNKFLSSYNLYHIAILKDSAYPIYGYHIIYGCRYGIYHAVVGKNGKIIHDPNKYFKPKEKFKIESYGLFIYKFNQ